MNQSIVIFKGIRQNNAIPKKDGGIYKGIELAFETADGHPKVKYVHESQVAKQAELLDKFRALEHGDVVELSEEKVGNFVNIVDVKKSDKSVSAGKDTSGKKWSGQKSTFVPRDDLGMKIGNAITNATNILVATKGAKASLKDLEEMVVEIAIMSERVRDRISNPTKAATTEAKDLAKKAPKAEVADVDEEDYEPL